jgi:hypothetical protein
MVENLKLILGAIILAGLFSVVPVEARAPVTRKSNPVIIPWADTILPIAATNSLFLQTRSFDSLSLAKALVHVRERGAQVEVIIAKGNETTPAFRFLTEHGVRVFIDVEDDLPPNMILFADEKVLSSESRLFHFDMNRFRITAKMHWEFHRGHAQ